MIAQILSYYLKFKFSLGLYLETALVEIALVGEYLYFIKIYKTNLEYLALTSSSLMSTSRSFFRMSYLACNSSRKLSWYTSLVFNSSKREFLDGGVLALLFGDLGGLTMSRIS